VLLERFHYVDLARKVVGSKRRDALLDRADARPGRARSAVPADQKEAEASLFEPFSGGSGLGRHSERVVEGQRLMQAASDIFLGWVHGGRDLDRAPHDYYVRQLRDWNDSFDLEAILPRGLAY
jgi:hypothetical protein